MGQEEEEDGSGTGFGDCPICLEVLRESDVVHPLGCECGYNFCAACAGHWMESSKCDYEEASDGNRHVKIRLQCPQCRNKAIDLQRIQETLRNRTNHEASQLLDVPDSELSAKQLRLKHAYSTDDDTSHGGGGVELVKSTSSDPSIFSMSDGSADERGDLAMDPAMFAGLDGSMTESEQAYVATLMVSGEASKLAQAAQILNGISELARQGVTPSMRGAPASSSSTTPLAVQQAMLTANLGSGSGAVGRALALGHTHQDRFDRSRAAALERLQKRHPLPARMPRFVTLDAWPASKYRPTLTFCDDEWDGTIADAFVRIHISNGGKPKHAKQNRYAPSANEEETSNSSPTQPRVLIASLKNGGPAGRLGLCKGDVVTHVNGEPLEGTAEDLTNLIYLFAESNSPTFTMVVNAEECTAQALRLRSLIK